LKPQASRKPAVSNNALGCWRPSLALRRRGHHLLLKHRPDARGMRLAYDPWLPSNAPEFSYGVQLRGYDDSKQRRTRKALNPMASAAAAAPSTTPLVRPLRLEVCKCSRKSPSVDTSNSALACNSSDPAEQGIDPPRELSRIVQRFSCVIGRPIKPARSIAREWNTTVLEQWSSARIDHVP
jgi:hypothetical protein